MASRVTIFRGVRSESMRLMIWAAARRASCSRSPDWARAEPLKGSARPSTSMRQFMLLAVNIPLQEPQVGQPWSSSSLRRVRLILPAFTAPTPSKTLTRSTTVPSGKRPAAIAPPLTKMAGMSRRIAAISIPGTILSQLGMHTMPSKQWAEIMVSTQSAISSRLGREKRIPPCPMAMPSSTPMVLNSKGTAPAARTASLTSLPKLWRWAWPGTMST